MSDEIKGKAHYISGNSWTISARVNPTEVVATTMFLERVAPGYPLKTISQITATLFKYVASLAIEEGVKLMETEEAMTFLTQRRYGRNAALDNVFMRQRAADKRHRVIREPLNKVSDAELARRERGEKRLSELFAQGKDLDEAMLILKQEGLD